MDIEMKHFFFFNLLCLVSIFNGLLHASADSNKKNEKTGAEILVSDFPKNPKAAATSLSSAAPSIVQTPKQLRINIPLGAAIAKQCKQPLSPRSIGKINAILDTGNSLKQAEAILNKTIEEDTIDTKDLVRLLHDASKTTPMETLFAIASGSEKAAKENAQRMRSSCENHPQLGQSFKKQAQFDETLKKLAMLAKSHNIDFLNAQVIKDYKSFLSDSSTQAQEAFGAALKEKNIQTYAQLLENL